MIEDAKQNALLLPEGTRLLHIGPMKTGSTALQNAARKKDAELLEYGTYYPGENMNHRRPAFAFMGKKNPFEKKVPWEKASQVPPMSQWENLLDSVNSKPHARALISHECIASAADDKAVEFVKALGAGQTHIAIALRSTADRLPSHYIQRLKGRHSEGFERWLQRYHGGADCAPPAAMQRYYDLSGLVERWAAAAGAENVMVIVTDKARKELLTEAFEQMLGLPVGILAAESDNGHLANRSMSLLEAEAIRRANETIRDQGVSWPLYLDVIRRGAINRVLGQRTPGTNEPKLRLPRWAMERAIEADKLHAARIAESGVRIVGDLEGLYSNPPPAAEDQPPVDETAIEIAAEMLHGAVMGAVKHNKKTTKRLHGKVEDLPQEGKGLLKHEIRKKPRRERRRLAAKTFTTFDLASALGKRVFRQVR